MQLLPLPPGARAAISPAAVRFDRAFRLDAAVTLPRARPLSIDPAATAVALLLAIAFVLLFWCARSIVDRRGSRTLARGIAWLGLALAAVTLAQRVTAPQTLYWIWPVTVRGISPFGPYANRNDVATWLVLAIPLTLGYAMARVQSHGRAALDDTTAVLGTSLCLMTGTLLLSASRSGLAGVGVGLASFGWWARRRSKGPRAWLAIAALAVASIAIFYGSVGAVAARVGETLDVGLRDRRAVWHETWAMTRDFWLTGVGIGAYVRGMLVYQQSPRFFYINHAHDEYLQLLTEGGVLLAIPLIAGAIAAGRTIVARFRDAGSSEFWIRLGAASGVLAVATQNIWETGLRIPANAALFAVVFAIALSANRSDVRSAQPLGRAADDAVEVRDR